MAVKLRLTRMGSKKKPTYRIVATDSRRPRSGQYLELVGTYAPVGAEAQVKINEEVALNYEQLFLHYSLYYLFLLNEQPQYILYFLLILLF